MDNIATVIENINLGVSIMGDLEAWRFILIWLIFVGLIAIGLIKALK